MTTTLKVIANSLGSGDYVIVAVDGESIFEGHRVTPNDLFHILAQTNGLADHVEYTELTDEQMENWQEFA